MSSIDFVKVLPHEMWCMVLNQLKAPEDLVNVGKCSIYFRTILLQKRVHFLFKNVANILVSQNHFNFEFGTEHKSVVSWISKKEMLICRRVCSTWNDSIEKLFERPTITGIYPFMDKHNHQDLTGIFNPNEWANPYVFSVAEPFRAHTFATEFNIVEQGTLKNPFLGRSAVLCVGLHNMINISIFNNAMTTILESFGHEIWYVIVYIKYSRFSTAAEDYLRLRQWLNFMPNLRSLRLHFHNHGIVESNLVANSPLPELYKLIHLGVSSVGHNVLNEVFKKYCHVSYLQIDDCFSVREWLPSKFTNLKGLFLDGHRRICSDIINWIGCSTNLETFFVYNKELQIRFCRQFQMIQKHWSNCLKDLTIKIEDYGGENINCTKNIVLKMPELFRLKIYSYGNLCIDFVQLLQNLEILDISLYNNDSGLDHNSQLYEELLIPQNKIQFIGFEKRMQESNIWSILLKLKKLRLNITRRYPILCYEYTKKTSGIIECNSFVQKPSTKIQIPNTYEYVFTNFHY